MKEILDRPRLITYSHTKRKLLEDDNQSIKRRRVGVADVASDDEEECIRDAEGTATRSSPSPGSSPGAPIFSDENALASSPPSSPSSVILNSDMSKPQRQPDAFSMLRRQPVSKRTKHTPKKPLIQMQLNLGQRFQKKCKTCGMTYMPSNPEDVAFHQKYHAQNVDGISISKDFLKKAEGWRGIEWIGQGGDDRIVSISRHWRCQSGRQFIMPVLKVVQAELGAVDIPDNLLWSLCYAALPGHTGSRGPEVQVESAHGPCYERYKAYLYTHGTKCVGLCLTERINKAFRVLEPQKKLAGSEVVKDEDSALQAQEKEQGGVRPDPDAPLTVTETADEAWMGISRIWVSSSFRKKGIASALLDCASKTFRERQTIAKDLIAFSQPTQSGARLARRWFGKTSGWHVYTDCNVVMECRRGEWYSRRDDEVPGPMQGEM